MADLSSLCPLFLCVSVVEFNHGDTEEQRAQRKQRCVSFRLGLWAQPALSARLSEKYVIPNE